MNLRPLARAFGALLGVGALAAALFVGLVTALTAAGVPRWVASPAAIGAVVPAMLAFADLYTPLGSSERTDVIREKRLDALVADFAATAAVGGVVGSVGAYALLGPNPMSLVRTAVVAVAVAIGYGVFVLRNLHVYRPGGLAADTDEFDPDA
jgi:hypothetical protein